MKIGKLLPIKFLRKPPNNVCKSLKTVRDRLKKGIGLKKKTNSFIIGFNKMGPKSGLIVRNSFRGVVGSSVGSDG